MVAKETLRIEFSKRLKLACDEAGIRERGRAVDLQRELKRRKVVASTTGIGKWLNSEAIPEIDKLRVLADWLGVRAAWLEHGELPMRSGANEQNDSTAKESNVIAADFSRQRLREGEIEIPQYDVRAAMGSGQAPADYIETIRNVVLHEAYLRSQGVSYTNASNLAVITGWGQSMEGTISDGDPVIVDRGVLEFVGDGVYVFTWDDMLYIKRLQKDSASTFDMISDNPKHKDRTVGIEDVLIHARVLLVWNAKKL